MEIRGVGCLAGALLWTSTSLAAPRSAIEIQVEVAEIDHSKAAQLGVDWLDRIGITESGPIGLVEIGSVGRQTPLRADLRFLVEEGAAELLAKPNLLTDSGTTATFHAGGEIPYATTANLGATNVEFKPYGVELEIRPKVTANGDIGMKVEAAVSAPDPTNGVTLAGTSVPALLERRVSSHVTVPDGATVALAGLVQSQQENVTRGIPLLRRIPLLGWLFRWTARRSHRTTIVIFVTPRLAQL